MKLVRNLFILSLMIVPLSCSTIKVDYEFDPAVNFTALKSYDWFPVPKKNVRHELIIRQIRSEMEHQLKSRGFSRTTEKPDFLIALHGGLQQFLTYEDFKYLREHFEPYWAQRRIDFSRYDDDTFIIDFVDSQTRKLFYRGTVTAFIMEPTAEKRAVTIHEAITKTLDNFQMLYSG